MSFEIALSGINAINTSLDTISNNIANSGTFGFKSSRANFSSTYAGTQPTGVEVGSLTQSIDIGGGILTTGRSLDASIQGRGFFVTKDTSGAELYTRVGIFSADKNGYLVDSFNRKVQGYQAVLNAAGVPIPGAGLGAMGNLQVPTGQIAAQATTQLQYVGNLSADWTPPAVATFNPADPLSYNGSLVSVVYDSLGAKHTVAQYFVKTGTNQVTVNYTFDGNVMGGAPPANTTTTLTFGPDGQLTSSPTPLTLNAAIAGANPLSIALNYTGTTQFAGDTINSVNAADGYASGALVGVQLSKDGSLFAQYSNGQKQIVGTVATATFAAENALAPVNDTSWTTTSGSGVALYGRPGAGMTGELTVGAIEQSNVDMTSELIGLMTSQRNYQANTKVISTENDMMKTLMQAV
jgi:flagellar hook protein FlgE